MQPSISLSKTESEYSALSAALRGVNAINNLPYEHQSLNLPIPNTEPRVICKVFEKNKSCIEIATNQKTRTHTKHLSSRLHHLRSNFVNKTTHIVHILTKEQVVDIFTKALPRYRFEKLRNKLMSWVPALPFQGSEIISLS